MAIKSRKGYPVKLDDYRVTSSHHRKCVILIDGLNSPYGTEMLAMLVACSLKNRGWEVTIFTGHYSRHHSAWRQMLDNEGITVFHPGFWLLNRYHLPYRFVVRRLWNWCKKNSPHLVWSPTNDTMTCLALKNRPEDSPLFFVHDPSDPVNCPHYPKLWYEVCNRVDALSVHGERQKASAVKQYGMSRPVDVVYPASARPLQSHLPVAVRGVVRFGQFGRMFSCKGTLFAVAAFAQVLARGHNAELHFFGDGPFRAATEELVNSLGLQERVFIHGAYFYPDLDTLVPKIDVGIMPSIYEGFGLVMLELMSRSRPVIATDVGSAREILSQFDAGTVVPRADTGALADAMCLFCEQPEQLRRMAINARATWETHFTPEAMTARYIEFWRKHGADI